MIQSNPSKREGFSYFFRDNRKTVFLRAPRGKKYHQFKVPKNKDPIKFVESLIISAVATSYNGFTVYYRKAGKLVRDITKADTVYVKMPRGRKFYDFELFQMPEMTPRESVIFLTKKIISRLDQIRRKKAEAKREKELKKAQEAGELEEPAEEVERDGITYFIRHDKGYYSSNRYGRTHYIARYLIVIPEILISQRNVDAILEYIENDAFPLILDNLLDMGVSDDQFFRVRLIGSGDYMRVKTDPRGNEIKVPDRFGFGLARDNFTEDMWFDYIDKFMDELRDRLTGKKSYLARAVSGKLVFEGFHIEIYD
jgi:hypothetical protein